MIHAGGVDYLSAYYGENEVLRMYIGDFLMWEGLIPVSFTFDGVTTSALSGAIEGESYTAVLSGTSGNKVQESSVIVTMGGVDITSTAYDHSTKTVTIAEVTGAISITAVGRPYDAEVEYLHSDGSQYIDSGIECTGDLKVHFNGLFTSTVNSSACGGIHTTSPYFRHHWTPYTSSQFYWIQKSTSNKSSILQSNSTNSYYEVVVDPVNGTGSVNGTAKTFTALSASNTTGQNYFIFARKASDGAVQGRPCRFKFFKMWRDDVLLRDFIPVRNNGVGYLYDKVSGELFGNGGTGDFTFGNDV